MQNSYSATFQPFVVCGARALQGRGKLLLSRSLLLQITQREDDGNAGNGNAISNDGIAVQFIMSRLHRAKKGQRSFCYEGFSRARTTARM